MSTSSSALSASAIRPGPTSSPASRSTRPNVTTWRTSASASSWGLYSSGFREEVEQRLVAHQLEVFVVLEHRPERRLDQVGVQLALAQRGQRLCPVDRLGDAGRLVQVEPAKALNE